MRNVWVVLRREYLERVRTRWFLYGTLAGPLLLSAVVLLPALVVDGGPRAGDRLAVQDRTGVLLEGVAERLRAGGLEVVPAGTSAEETSRLRGAVTEGRLSGYLVLDEETLRSGRVSWYGEEAPGSLRGLSIRQAVVTTALTLQLRRQGVEPGALLAGGSLETTVLGSSGSDDAESRFLLGFLGAFVLYMVILLYAVAVMRATLQEKTNRLVEVILSAMEPWHLMLGKILGVGAVGLTQLAVWLVVGGTAAVVGLPSLVERGVVARDLSGLAGELEPRLGLVFAGLFLAGYVIYSSLYAAVGAMCTTDEEAQQAQLPVMFLILVPMLLIVPVLDQPASAFATGMSLVPFFTPILLWPRVVAGVVPGWQLALAFLLMAGTVLVVAWVAGRIYTVGVLMTGKRPTLSELWRWVREA